MASAHSQIVSSEPVDGAALAAAPSAVTFTFNEALLEEAVSVAISDSAGNVVSGTVATADGAQVSVPWPAGLKPGAYTVAYRVVSADGHPVTGAITFSYLAAADASLSPSSPLPVSAGPEPTQVDELPVSGSSPSVAPLAILGFVLAICAVVAIIYAARRWRS